jgi:hypothetical protein
MLQSTYKTIHGIQIEELYIHDIKLKLLFFIFTVHIQIPQTEMDGLNSRKGSSKAVLVQWYSLEIKGGPVIHIQSGQAAIYCYVVKLQLKNTTNDTKFLNEQNLILIFTVY